MRFQLFSDAFLTWMAVTLIHGTALVLLTWLASITVFRHCRPAVHAALWTVVLIKFLLPPVWPSNFGLSSMLDSLLSQTDSIQTIQMQTGSIIEPGNLPLVTEESRVLTLQTFQGFFLSYLPNLLTLSYAGCFLLLLVKTLHRSYCMGQRIRRLPHADKRLSGEVDTLARHLGLRRVPRVRLDSTTVSPFVIGAWSPTLVLPPTLPEQISASAREALIIHELAHIRRGDVMVRWLQNLARLLFFFWPPVWWLCHRLERSSEMACDHWAVKFSSVSPQTYAESLLNVAKGMRAQTLRAPVVGFATRRTHLMVERFQMILAGSQGKSPGLSWQMVAVLAGWSLFALTGSVLARTDRAVTPIGDATEARVQEQQAQKPQPTKELIAALASPQKGQENEQEQRRRQDKERERKRVEEARRLNESSEGIELQSLKEAAAREVAAYLQNRAEELKQSTLVDLNGDGVISDFEAGYSAALGFNKRKTLATESNPSLHTTQMDATRGEDQRRKEIELKLQRLKAPTNRVP